MLTMKKELHDRAEKRLRMRAVSLSGAFFDRLINDILPP